MKEYHGILRDIPWRNVSNVERLRLRERQNDFFGGEIAFGKCMPVMIPKKDAKGIILVQNRGAVNHIYSEKFWQKYLKKSDKTVDF